MNLLFFGKKIGKNQRGQRGMVLLVVLTSIVFLTVLGQEMAFNTQLEYKTGAGQYHSLKAYYAAKSGVELALLRILIYKQALSYINKIPSAAPIKDQARSYADLIWREPLSWPPLLHEDLSEIKTEEIQELVEESFFTSSYSVQIQALEAKLNLNNMSSPVEPVRRWTKSMFYNLLMRLRESSPWMEEKYSINDLTELTETVYTHLNPSLSIPNPYNTPLNRQLLYLNELQAVEGFENELIEKIRPYVTLFGSEGFSIQYANKELIQGLQTDTNEENLDNMMKQIEEENIILSSFEQTASIFEEHDIPSFRNAYEKSEENQESLHKLLFHFDAPSHFQIVSRGFSNQSSQTIEAFFYDPNEVYQRTYKVMEQQKKFSGYTSSTDEESKKRNLLDYNAPAQIITSPFIIHWKHIH